MTATKTPGRHSHDKPASASTKHVVAAKVPGPRPLANNAKGIPAAPGTTPRNSSPSASNHVQGASTSGRPATSAGSDAGPRKSSQPVQPKQRTLWTIDAASRVASATARRGDGQVKKGSFAAEAMSKAMKNEHKPKGGR